MNNQYVVAIIAAILATRPNGATPAEVVAQAYHLLVLAGVQLRNPEQKSEEQA